MGVHNILETMVPFHVIRFNVYVRHAFTSNVNIMTSIPCSNYSSAFKRVRAAMAPRPQPKIPSYI